MSFGIYIHIPYCVQRCTYCDFATYEQSKIQPPEEYGKLLFEEIRQRHRYFQAQQLHSLYFGGGTPSLIAPEIIVSLIHELAKYGFTIGPETEATIEINPYTITEQKLETYLKAGINRFSVGAQTFDNRLLKMVKREHNAQQTLDTLALLRRFNLNFNFDILFALPHQTLDGLKKDVEIALQQGASHISPYCLTIPENHILSQGRPLEEEQIEMFQVLDESLQSAGFYPYEISNYSLQQRESKHNLLYWTDQPYWGIGLSAHSYSKNSPWGTRFWNLSSMNTYQVQIESRMGEKFDRPAQHLPENQLEELAKHQALTDFCHTSLRLMRGLDISTMCAKFFNSSSLPESLHSILTTLENRKLLEPNEIGWALSRQGVLVSNQVFAAFTFLEGEIC